VDPLWILLAGVLTVVGGIIVLRLQAFLALIAGALIVSALTPTAAIVKFEMGKKATKEAAEKIAKMPVGERVAREFGSTCAKIGIMIAMASIIGRCLMESGGADRIVRSLLGLLGEKNAPVAFAVSSYLLGIPAFLETVFLLMIPIGKALWRQTGRNYVLYVLSIIVGATITHSLVPPAPGPLFVAKALDVDMGLMMVGGCVIGAFATVAGYLFAIWRNKTFEVPLRDLAVSGEQLKVREEKDMPPLWLALMPIALPMAMITSATVAEIFERMPSMASLVAPLKTVFATLGDANIALTVSAVFGLGMLISQNREHFKQMGKTVGPALEEAGMIILIIGAGGAFGGVLQQTGVGDRIQELSKQYHVGVLFLAWLVTAMVRVAQGSATVAMITAIGMVGGLATESQLGFHPVYVAIAIGCGSKMMPWMNDGGFWVVCKVSGMNERETLKTFSAMLSVMGVAGLLVTMLLARFFPHF
jgi:GntP family gluconate:H+ symporter